MANKNNFLKESEIAFNKSLTVLGASWSNVILAQPPFIDKFNTILGRKWHNYAQRSVNTTLYSQIVQNIQAIIIWLPCGIAVFLYLSSHELKESIVLLAFLPRIIELLLDMSHIAMNLIKSGNVIGQLNWLDRFILQLNSPSMPMTEFNFQKFKFTKMAFILAIYHNWDCAIFTNISNIWAE